MQNRPGGPPAYGGGSRQTVQPERREYVTSPDYLRGGYLDNRKNPRPELITSEADQVAEDLWRADLTYGQARKFYEKARFIQLQLDSKKNFEDQVWRIASLERDAADAVGRRSAPPVFKAFIEKNIVLAKRDEDHFRKGFMQHFQSVLAYFRYRRPKP